MISLNQTLQLNPAEGSPVEKFGSTKFLEDNTKLSRRFGARTEKATAGGYAYDKVTFLRSLAPITGRGAASKSVLTESSSRFMIGGAYIRINFQLTGELLNALRNPGDISANAAAKIERTVRSMRNRILLTKEKLWSMMFTGTTTIDSSTFPDGTVEGVSISWGVNALAVSAAWSAISTPIFSSDVPGFDATIVDASGVGIKEFVYNETVEKLLKKNTELKDWATHLPDGISIIKKGQFGGFGDVEGWTKYMGSYQPDGGSVTRYVANNALIALPEGAEEMLVEARFPMDRPSTGMLVATGDPAGMAPDEVFGDADGIDTYVYQRPDPAGMVIVCQAAIQPINKYPEAFGYESSVLS